VDIKSPPCPHHSITKTHVMGGAHRAACSCPVSLIFSLCGIYSSLGSSIHLLAPKLVVGAAPKQNFLTDKELSSINSIDCLQQKKRNPNHPCQKAKVEGSVEDSGSLSISNYPHWQSSTCHSNQELFCDPTEMLSYKQEVTASEHLRLFKERTLVNCGQLESIMDPDEERRGYEKKNPIFSGRLGLEDYREFNLAVVLADEWPKSEMDPTSVKYFGQKLMTDWGMMPFYNGVDQGNPLNQIHQSYSAYRGFCPHSAVLFILPRFHEAYLYAPSCEYLCAARGGPEVVAATLAGLDRGGVETAILAGIDEAERVLRATIPLSILKPTIPKRWQSKNLDLVRSDAATTWTLRILFASVILLFVGVIASCLYFTVHTPVKEQRVRNVMFAGGRQEIQEGLMNA